MKNYILKFFGRFTLKLSVIFILIFVSCSKEKDSNETTENLSNIDSDDIVISLEGALQISDFVWKGLNQYYYWLEQAGERITTESFFTSFKAEFTAFCKFST